MKEQRRQIAALTKVDRGQRAEAIFDAAAIAMQARPPTGIDSVYVSGFLRRQRPTLVALIGRLFRA